MARSGLAIPGPAPVGSPTSSPSNGGLPITTYTAICNPGGLTGIGNLAPVIVNNLVIKNVLVRIIGFVIVVVQHRTGPVIGQFRFAGSLDRTVTWRVDFQHLIVFVSAQIAFVVGDGGAAAATWHITDHMGQGMTPEITVPPEHFAARRALVRLVVGVRQQVRLQIGTLIEAPAADRAFVRRLVQMEDPVNG